MAARKKKKPATKRVAGKAKSSPKRKRSIGAKRIVKEKQTIKRKPQKLAATRRPVTVRRPTKKKGTAQAKKKEQPSKKKSTVKKKEQPLKKKSPVKKKPGKSRTSKSKPIRRRGQRPKKAPSPKKPVRRPSTVLSPSLPVRSQSPKIQPPSPQKPKKKRAPTPEEHTVLTSTEVLQAKAWAYWKKIDKSGNLQGPDDYHKFDEEWSVSYSNYFGLLKNTRIKQLLTESTLSSILEKTEAALNLVFQKRNDGRLFVTFMFFDYGTVIGGSPDERYYKDVAGDFFRTFDSTKGAESVDAALQQCARMLENLMERKYNATIVDNVTAKSYVFTDSKARSQYAASRRKRKSKGSRRER